MDKIVVPVTIGFMSDKPVGHLSITKELSDFLLSDVQLSFSVACVNTEGGLVITALAFIPALSTQVYIQNGLRQWLDDKLDGKNTDAKHL